MGQKILGVCIAFYILIDFQIEERLLGCYVYSQENIVNNIQFELIYTNTPSICAAICSNSAYQFGGVQR